MTPFLLRATDHHLVKALRFWPVMSSTSGTSASGQDPVAPSGPDAVVTLNMTSANTRRFPGGMTAPLGPVSGWDQEYELRVSARPGLSLRTTSWNDSYSFRAA